MKMVVSKLHSIWLRLKFSPKVRQMLAGGGLSHGAIAIGNVIGWFPHALETLLTDPAFQPFPQEKLVWMMLLVMIGALFGLVPAAYSAARFGRIWTMRFFCLLLLGGWILVAAASSVDMILAGRFLLGVSCGGFLIVTPLYIIEVAEVKLRGMLGYMYTQQIYLGVVMALFTARHDPWSILTLHMCPIAVITFIFTLFVPDSPVWHLRQGDTEKARESLRWLRAVAPTDNDDAVQAELGQLQDLVGAAPSGVGASGGNRLTFGSMLSMPPYKSLIWTTIGLLCIQPLLTISPVHFCTVWINVIARGGGGSIMKATTAGFALSNVILLGMGIFGHLSVKLSRKKLLTASCLLSVVAFGVLGALYYADPSSERLYWPQFAGFCVLFLVYGIGFVALPHLFLVEGTHPRYVEVVLCMATGFQWVIVMGLSFVLGPLIWNPSFGIGPTFWVSAGLCVLAALLTYYNMPETNGKSLAEIQGAAGSGSGSRPGSQQNMINVSSTLQEMGSVA